MIGHINTIDGTINGGQTARTLAEPCTRMVRGEDKINSTCMRLQHIDYPSLHTWTKLAITHPWGYAARDHKGLVEIARIIYNARLFTLHR